MFRTSQDFDSNLRPRERHLGLPRLAIRQRSADHPMAMFFIIVSTVFAAAALVSPTGTAFASLDATAAPVVSQSGASGKTSRLPLSETDIVCRGQAWGAESEACLAVIGKQAGKERKVRLVAAGEPMSTAPNIF